jgi:hypothetical protein
VNIETLQLLGRARLIDELLEDGLNVALPMRAGEIDMLAYIDSSATQYPMASVPIKVKSLCSFPISTAIEGVRSPCLLTAFVWGTNAPARAPIFALTLAELVVVKMIGVINRANAAQAGGAFDEAYRSNAILPDVLEPYAMSVGKWRRKISALLERP